MNEEWRLFFHRLYEVSSTGRIRRATAGVNTYAGREKKAGRSENGYMLVGLYIGGRRTNVLVHQAVATAFLGPCPEGMEVNHKDGNKAHNYLDNLEYLTRPDNAKHAIRLGLSRPPTERSRGDKHWTRLHPEKVKRGSENGAALHPDRIKRGESCPASKLTEDKVRSIRVLHACGVPASAIAAQFKVTGKNVYYIVNRKSWRHVP